MSQTRFVAIGNVTLHYTQEGIQDGSALVFINSLGTDLRIWDRLAACFDDHFSVVRYDKRGHGLSDCPPGPYSIPDLTDDLVGLLTHLAVDEAIFIGISVGGLIALNCALRYPQKVKALVLCDTAARIGAAELWNQRIEAVRNNGMEYVAEAIMARWFVPELSRHLPAEYRGYYNMLTRTPAIGYIATCEAIRDADFRNSVSAVKAKSLVLCGAEDVATPPAAARELAQWLPDARFELIENAGHLPCIEQPDAMATRISQFFQENGYVR